MFLSRFQTSFLALSLVTASFAGGCASENGSSPAVASFDFEAGFHTDAANLSNGLFVDKNKDKISMKSMKLNLSEIRLVAKSASGGNGAKFDPSNPPEPYENCHANHCHIKGSSDTKTFAEIEAELSGGSVKSTDVLVLKPNKAIELKSLSDSVEFEGVASGELPYGEINEIHVTFDKYSLEAQNTTSNATASLKNEHQHGDHVHTEPLELSHAVDIDIVQGSEKDQDIHLVLEIKADILNEVFGNDVDFADLMAEHASLEIKGHDHEHEHAH